jgi:hypothetical protein
MQGINDSGQDIVYAVSDNTTLIVASSGGTVGVATTSNQNYYTQHKLVVPANAISSNVNIAAGKPGNNQGFLSAVSFSPATVVFSQNTPASLVIQYKEKDVKEEAGYIENGMRIHQWNNSAQKWVILPETYSMQSIDTANNTVTIKINKLNMLGVNTTIVFANIDLPTVEASSTIVTASPGFWEGKDKLFFASNTITLSVGTSGLYTKHKLALTNYIVAPSGIIVTLKQPVLTEKHGWLNNSMLKIITTGEITTQAILTMEYKDHDDPNNQFRNDVIGGEEYKMRIYHWRDDLARWEKVAEPQIANRNENTVTVSFDTLDLTQIYAVGIDPDAQLVVAVNYPWELY